MPVTIPSSRRGRATGLLTSVALVSAGLLVGGIPASATPERPHGPVIGYTGVVPTGVAITPDGATAYVGDANSNRVSVIDMATNTQIGAVSGYTGRNSLGVAVSPDGAFAYVTSPGLQIAVIDTRTNTQIGAIALGMAVGSIAFSPDGTTAYATNALADELGVIDTATHTQKGTITGLGGGAFLAGLAVSPDGAKVYVVNKGRSSVAAVDTATNRATMVANYAGSEVNAVQFSADGDLAYVTNAASDTISVIDVASDTQIDTIPTGQWPVGIALTADGAFAYVTLSKDKSIMIIDTARRASVGTLPGYAGSNPNAIALTSDGETVLVAGWHPSSLTSVKTARPAPSASSIEPSRGLTDGGTSVTIAGEHLLGTTGVTFDGAAGTNFSVAADGQSLTVTTPAGTMGDVDVQIQHPQGDMALENAYAYFTTPSAPTGLVATGGDGLVQLHWSAPESDGGAPIAGYAIWHSPVGSDTWTLAAETEAPGTTITELDNNTVYQFRAKAANEAGHGDHATITAQPGGTTIIAPTPSPSAPPAGRGEGLASTGMNGENALLFGAIALTIGAALALFALHRRRHEPATD